MLNKAEQNGEEQIETEQSRAEWREKTPIRADWNKEEQSGLKQSRAEWS